MRNTRVEVPLLSVLWVGEINLGSLEGRAAEPELK